MANDDEARTTLSDDDRDELQRIEQSALDNQNSLLQAQRSGQLDANNAPFYSAEFERFLRLARALQSRYPNASEPSDLVARIEQWASGR